MEPKFHADWSRNRRDRGLCMYCVYNDILFFQISSFLDVANVGMFDTLSDSIRLLNFAKKMTHSIFDSISFFQDSIKNIIQFKDNSTDSKEKYPKNQTKYTVLGHILGISSAYHQHISGIIWAYCCQDICQVCCQPCCQDCCQNFSQDCCQDCNQDFSPVFVRIVVKIVVKIIVKIVVQIIVVKIVIKIVVKRSPYTREDFLLTLKILTFYLH